jgi:heme exporter protein D
MDRWDVLLAAFATYVAIVSLVRLMANRHNEVLAKIRDELAKQRGRSKANDDSHDQKAA